MDFTAAGQKIVDTWNYILGVRSGKWPKARAKHLEKTPECAACGSTKNVIVHHIIPVGEDPTLELEESNFITLCENAGHHHLVFGHLNSFRSWNTEVVEDCRNYLKKLRSRPCQ